MVRKRYKIAFLILIIGWGLATALSEIVAIIQHKIIVSIEYAYECKSQGKTLHQCEHEIKDKIQ